MYDGKLYVPILKGKRAETNALRDLSPRVRDQIIPLVEVMPEGFKDAKAGTRRSLDTHLATQHARLLKSWGTAHPFFLDFRIDPGRNVGSKTVARFVFDDMIADGMKFVPVTAIDATLTYQDTVREAILRTGSGACVRIQYKDFDPLTLPARFEDLRRFLGLAPEQLDVVIDLRHIEDHQVPALVLAVQSVLGVLPEIDKLRSLTLASSAFPKHTGDCERDKVTTLPRADWNLWTKLRERNDLLPRLPMYGDYAITNPEFTEFDPKTMRVSAQLRYTAQKEFLVAKGRALGFGPPDQTIALCSWITGHTEFRGAQFSAGDAYIANRAAGAPTPGSPETWLWAGTTHHLTLAVQQLASLGAP